MNFKIFDDDFENEKSGYKSELDALAKDLIQAEDKKIWQTFVNDVLVDTRSYYILLYSLKVMKNLNAPNVFGNDKDYFNNALVSAMTFFPDKTFIETAIMVVAKFHEKGIALARNQGVNIDVIYSSKTKTVNKNPK